MIGEYAEMSLDREFDEWLDEGCPGPKVVPVREGDRCSAYGCEGIMVMRQNSKTGKYFLGCSQWPNCPRYKKRSK